MVCGDMSPSVRVNSLGNRDLSNPFFFTPTDRELIFVH